MSEKSSRYQRKKTAENRETLESWRTSTMRKYWITTHWPPESGEQIKYGVYLYDGTQGVGTDMEPGDRAWIYQSKGGRLIVRE